MKPFRFANLIYKPQTQLARYLVSHVYMSLGSAEITGLCCL